MTKANKAANHRKAVLHLKKSDPVLAVIIERIGPCRIEFGEPTFHSLAESILYQQLNGKAAATIFDRFTALAGDPLTAERDSEADRRPNARSRLVAPENIAICATWPRKRRPVFSNSNACPEMTEDEVIAHLTR